jgi:choline monooxygenase
MQSTLLSASAYIDAAALDAERAAIFGREWLFVADVSLLAVSGQYVAAHLAGFPLVTVNDGGILRAFHNVCRHRGGPLAWDGGGSCTRFVCQYHGWSYTLDGRLHSARDFGDDALDTSVLSLVPVRVETWRGLVFANFAPEAPPLVDWLGGMVEECAAYPMEAYRATYRESHRVAANWKVYAENYQEGYHIPLVHPGLHRQIDSRRYEVDVRDGFSVHRAPTRDGSATSGVWLWKFPGFALNVYPGGMCVESYLPIAPAETQVDYVFFFAEDTPLEEAQAAVASSNTILDEDRRICEAVQRNYSSGLYAGGVLSPRHERGVADVQRRVLRALNPDGQA